MQYLNECEFERDYPCAYSPCMDGSPLAIGHRLSLAMETPRPPFKQFLSQVDLFSLSRVPQPTISRILKGQGKRGPETETLKKLAAACHVHFNWLNEGIGPQWLDESVTGSSQITVVRKIEYDKYVNPKTLNKLIKILSTVNALGEDRIIQSAEEWAELYPRHGDDYQKSQEV